VASGSMRYSRVAELFLIFAALLLVVGSILGKAVGTDGMNQVYWLHDYAALVSQGTFLPRWIPNGFHGLGAPSFYFYPPLAFYLGAIIHIVTGISDGYALFQATALVSAVGGFIATWLFLRRIQPSNYRAILGGVLYAIAPYKIAEWYSRSSISATVGFIFLPLFALALFDIVQNDRASRMRGMIVLAISFTLMLLGSIPLALVAVICGGITIIVFRKNIKRQTIPYGIGAILLCIGLSAFYTLPVYYFGNYTQLRHLENIPEYFVNDIVALRITPVTYHYSIMYAAIVAIVATGFYLIKKNKLTTSEETALKVFLSIAAFIFVLEIPPISIPLWKAPILYLIQGSWRFYIVLVLLVVAVVAVAENAMLRRATSAAIIVWSLGSGIALIVAISGHHFNRHKDGDIVDPPEYATIYSLRDRDAFEAMTREHADDPIAFISSSQPGDSIQRRTATGTNQNLDVRLASARMVTFHQLYWPPWRLSVGDKELQTTPDSIGRALATLPSGHYTAHWYLEVTPIERLGRWISGLTLLGLVLISVASFARSRRKNVVTNP